MAGKIVLVLCFVQDVNNGLRACFNLSYGAVSEQLLRVRKQGVHHAEKK